jgi:glutaredoxin 3
VSVSKVEIYVKMGCPYCIRALRLLDSKGVEYERIAVDFGGENKALMVQRANGRTTVPQIFIDGRHIGGCDDLMAIERRGEPDPPQTARR